jgi:hypothetical protein
MIDLLCLSQWFEDMCLFGGYDAKTVFIYVEAACRMRRCETGHSLKMENV